MKPIASITLVSLSPFVVVSEGRPSFPIGSNALFGVTLHDNTGRLFDVANIPMKHSVSRLVVLFCFTCFSSTTSQLVCYNMRLHMQYLSLLWLEDENSQKFSLNWQVFALNNKNFVLSFIYYVYRLVALW